MWPGCWDGCGAGPSARTLYATLGESILRHLVSAGCCMPFRCGVSTMLTLAPARSAWQRQSAHGHPRLMSQMVTAGREVAREIRLMLGFGILGVYQPRRAERADLGAW
jgi:hypothetical protein